MSNTFYDALNSQYSFTGNWYDLVTAYADASSGLGSTLTSYTSSANTDLATLNVDLCNNIAQQNIVLTQQQNIQRILDREQKRLNQKQNSIDTVIQGQKRMTQLNDSYTSKYQAYNRVLIFLTIMVAIIVVVLLLGKTGRIPDTVLTIIIIIVISITIISLVYMIYGIARRDNMNFNKIGYAQTMSPETAIALTQNQTNSDGTSIFTAAMNNLGVCYGASCCSSDTSYNLATGMCEVNGTSVSSFVNLESAYTGNDLGVGVTFNGGSNIGNVAPSAGASSINYTPF